MQDFSQTISAVSTKLDMKDEDHGFYALMCCFCIYGVYGKHAYGWIDDTQDFSQTTTADDTKHDMKDEGHGLYLNTCDKCR